jgi:hypothetical protein
MGSVLGLLAGLAFGALRLGLLQIQQGVLVTPAPPFNGELLGGLAFASAYLFPFALSLFAPRWRSPALRAAMWLATAVMALLAAFTTFSIVGLVAFPLPALFLLLAALFTFRAAGWRRTIPILAVAAGLVVIGAGAWRVLFLSQDGRCWDQVRAADGTTFWQESPYGTSGYLSANPAPGESVSRLCNSDIITPVEGALSVGLWALAFLGLRWLQPRWGSALPAPNTSEFVPKTT